jgi:hypothetical protein
MLTGMKVPGTAFCGSARKVLSDAAVQVLPFAPCALSGSE